VSPAWAHRFHRKEGRSHVSPGPRRTAKEGRSHVSPGPRRTAKRAAAMYRPPGEPLQPPRGGVSVPCLSERPPSGLRVALGCPKPFFLRAPLRGGSNAAGSVPILRPRSGAGLPSAAAARFVHAPLAVCRCLPPRCSTPAARSAGVRRLPVVRHNVRLRCRRADLDPFESRQNRAWRAEEFETVVEVDYLAVGDEGVAAAARASDLEEI
jgi:hypothetical protein